MGVGSSDRLSAVRWGVAGNIVIAWVLTLPAVGAGGRRLADVVILDRASSDRRLGRAGDQRRASDRSTTPVAIVDQSGRARPSPSSSQRIA